MSRRRVTVFGVRGLVAIVVFAACQQSTSSPPGPRPVPEPVPAPADPHAHAPFVIHNKLVDETGKVVKVLSHADDYVQAVPVGPHRYRAGTVVVDTVAMTETPELEPAIYERVKDKDDDYTLIRREPDGRTRWTAQMHGVRSVRPPDIAVGGGRTIAAVVDTVKAFDDATGKLVWTATDVEGDRLTIAGDNVLSTFCNEPTHDHWLIGNALADGKQKFRIALVDGCDPWVAAVDGLIYVVDDHRSGGGTWVLDFAGKQLAKLDEQVQTAKAAAWGTASHTTGTGRHVLLTDKRVLAIDDAGKIVWRGPTIRNGFVGGADFAELPGGDLVVANYGAISDSGVDVVRLHADGSVAWRSSAAPLMVAHSQYQHLAYIEVRGDQLFVISQGSYGAFFERMSLATGERELRCVMDQPCTDPRKPAPVDHDL